MKEIIEERDRLKRDKEWLLRELAGLKHATPHFGVPPTVGEYIARLRTKLDQIDQEDTP